LGKEVLFTQSSTFNPSLRLDQLPPDTILLTVDNVLFLVHASRLLRLSANHFASLLWFPLKGTEDCLPFIIVDENSAILTIVLQIFYEMYNELSSHTLDAFALAFRSLRKYGVHLQEIIAPHMPLMEHLLSYAPVRAIELYALAAENELESLAVIVSSYLLSYSIADLPDELAVSIGARYLKRLYCLQQNRMISLRGLLLSSPELHSPSPACGMMEQRKLSRAWAFAAAQLAWDAGPGMLSWQYNRG
jgi:hypothetical protein